MSANLLIENFLIVLERRFLVSLIIFLDEEVNENEKVKILNDRRQYFETILEEDLQAKFDPKENFNLESSTLFYILDQEEKKYISSDVCLTIEVLSKSIDYQKLKDLSTNLYLYLKTLLFSNEKMKDKFDREKIQEKMRQRNEYLRKLRLQYEQSAPVLNNLSNILFPSDEFKPVYQFETQKQMKIRCIIDPFYSTLENERFSKQIQEKIQNDFTISNLVKRYEVKGDVVKQQTQQKIEHLLIICIENEIGEEEKIQSINNELEKLFEGGKTFGMILQDIRVFFNPFCMILGFSSELPKEWETKLKPQIIELFLKKLPKEVTPDQIKMKTEGTLLVDLCFKKQVEQLSNQMEDEKLDNDKEAREKFRKIFFSVFEGENGTLSNDGDQQTEEFIDQQQDFLEKIGLIDPSIEGQQEMNILENLNKLDLKIDPLLKTREIQSNDPDLIKAYDVQGCKIYNDKEKKRFFVPATIYQNNQLVNRCVDLNVLINNLKENETTGIFTVAQQVGESVVNEKTIENYLKEYNRLRENAYKQVKTRFLNLVEWNKRFIEKLSIATKKGRQFAEKTIENIQNDYQEYEKMTLLLMDADYQCLRQKFDVNSKISALCMNLYEYLGYTQKIHSKILCFQRRLNIHLYNFENNLLLTPEQCDRQEQFFSTLFRKTLNLAKIVTVKTVRFLTGKGYVCTAVRISGAILLGSGIQALMTGVSYEWLAVPFYSLFDQLKWLGFEVFRLFICKLGTRMVRSVFIDYVLGGVIKVVLSLVLSSVAAIANRDSDIQKSIAEAHRRLSQVWGIYEIFDLLKQVAGKAIKELQSKELAEELIKEGPTNKSFSVLDFFSIVTSASSDLILYLLMSHFLYTPVIQTMTSKFAFCDEDYTKQYKNNPFSEKYRQEILRAEVNQEFFNKQIQRAEEFKKFDQSIRPKLQSFSNSFLQSKADSGRSATTFLGYEIWFPSYNPNVEYSLNQYNEYAKNFSNYKGDFVQDFTQLLYLESYDQNKPLEFSGDYVLEQMKKRLPVLDSALYGDKKTKVELAFNQIKNSIQELRQKYLVINNPLPVSEEFDKNMDEIKNSVFSTLFQYLESNTKTKEIFSFFVNSLVKIILGTGTILGALSFNQVILIFIPVVLATLGTSAIYVTSEVNNDRQIKLVVDQEKNESDPYSPEKNRLIRTVADRLNQTIPDFIPLN